ncbi:hypothetical protein PYW07_011982 [Mythimna separata]|uniref:Small ribosomal subunit protein uS12m n=1 Tax=Mythimna separata TaxID=271217 RepID=A0AAD8DTB7_MYTSE|nr:hypothetical protein PYW07_011982 [Mythimna separata]
MAHPDACCRASSQAGGHTRRTCPSHHSPELWKAATRGTTASFISQSGVWPSDMSRLLVLVEEWKPEKSNSASRACVLVRLLSGKEMVAYVPGIGHNLQEHNIVLVRVGRLKDCPGVKLKCVSGKHDLPQVIKQKVQ